MLASLKKIKLEKGGEDLILATVRADNVDTFKRLQNKSEPTWLLAIVRLHHNFIGSCFVQHGLDWFSFDNVAWQIGEWHVWIECTQTGKDDL